ncbi:DNA primase [Halorubrum sp. SD612]|uniref:DNA primase n=1 Tax=Halorubrum sp. SD612 TaxID=1855863 RepID=UPI000A2EBD85|nr:DNA primase [Halorubrum sp. SD612]OTF01038.1 DNA primase [Halorubrum sp. SD612]
MSERTTAILLIAVVALGAMTGVAAADGHLEVAVDDADGEPTVTVTENDTAVENATVVVSVVDAENESYAGSGEYETDANGTVDLEAPEEDVTVEVTAASGNDTASTTVDLEAPDGLELDVDDTGGEPVVTVTDDDEAVENASVNVTVADDENASYAGTGEYETDANGTVDLPAAEEDVTVEVTAEYENASVSETVEFEAPDGLEVEVDDTDEEPTVTVTDDDEPVENATVVVALADDADENASYAGTGEYETDANGTVGLPAAEEDVAVDVTTSYDDRTASTTVELTAGDEDDAPEETPFGQLIRDFIEDISDREGGIGAAVSDFATENNPGNAPDHAGGPGGADDGDASEENESDAPGNVPDHAGGPDGENDSDERGPPAHAGPGGDDADDDDVDEEDDDAEDDDAEEDDAEEDDAEEDDAEEDDAEEDDAEEDDAEEDDAEDDGERGPPDHAGGPGGN